MRWLADQAPRRAARARLRRRQYPTHLLGNFLVSIRQHDTIVGAVAGAMDKMRVPLGIIKGVGTLAEFLRNHQQGLAPRIGGWIINVDRTSLSGGVLESDIAMIKQK